MNIRNWIDKLNLYKDTRKKKTTNAIRNFFGENKENDRITSHKNAQVDACIVLLQNLEATSVVSESKEMAESKSPPPGKMNAAAYLNFIKQLNKLIYIEINFADGTIGNSIADGAAFGDMTQISPELLRHMLHIEKEVMELLLQHREYDYFKKAYFDIQKMSNAPDIFRLAHDPRRGAINDLPLGWKKCLATAALKDLANLALGSLENRILAAKQYAQILGLEHNGSSLMYSKACTAEYRFALKAGAIDKQAMSLIHAAYGRVQYVQPNFFNNDGPQTMTRKEGKILEEQWNMRKFY